MTGEPGHATAGIRAADQIRQSGSFRERRPPLTGTRQGDGGSTDDDLSHFSIEHRARRLSGAGTPGNTPGGSRGPRSPEARRAIRRDLVLIALTLLVAVALTPFGDVPNPGYAEAREIADRLDAAYALVWQDGVPLEDAAIASGMRVYEFSLSGRTVSVLVDPEPSSLGKCYGLRLGGGLDVAAVRFAPTDGCVPLGPSAFEVAGTWGDVLGTERVTSVWFVPAVVLIIGLLLSLATNIVLKLLPR